MADFIRREKDDLFDSFDDWRPSCVQRALYHAIQYLRYENIETLIQAGVWLFPWSQPKVGKSNQAKDPFRIKWAVFNQNRNAFLRCQAVLDTYGLAKLKLVI